MGISELLAARAAAIRSDSIDEVFQRLRSREDVVSFAAGAPDQTLLPVALLPVTMRRALARHGAALLQYGSPRGFDPLRVACRPLLAERGIHVPADRIHIMTGGSGALDTFCMALLEPGDVVLVERPTYAPALKVFRTYDARVEEISCDSDGMLPEALDERLRAGRVKFVYLLPTFQNPTGRTISATRRAALAEVLRGQEALAIEDDVYWQLRYEGDPIPALWRWAPDNVVYLSSLSKTLAPTLRIGIVVAPASLERAAIMLKQGVDMHTSVLAQAIAAELLTSPDGRAHVNTVVHAYQKKRDILLAALDSHLPPGYAWTRPVGGMFVWVDAPADIHTASLLSSAFDAGVAYQPGGPFHVEPATGRNTLRLSIGQAQAAQIDPAIATLATVLARAPHDE